MMKATVYGVRTGAIVAERFGDMQSLVGWFNECFGEGYTCDITNSRGEVLASLAF